jgi:probable phosphoglycerate mutase
MSPVVRPALAPGSRIVIVRHGEAVGGIENIVAGHLSCKGLTEHGRRQVEALAGRLRHTGELEGAVALYSSILPRAVESAEILAPALGGLPVQSTCDLCERHVGDADGMTWSEYEAQYGVTTDWSSDPDREFAPGGETWMGFLDRAEAALYEVMERHPGRLVVVASHGGVVATSMKRFLGLADHGAALRCHPDNSSMTEWSWTGARWWLVRYNDAAHLDTQEWAGDTRLRIPAPGWVQAETQEGQPELTGSQQEISGSKM